jgi:hypothetical protein
VGNQSAPAERPIFVVGCPRSGTTLLSTMLHAHPRIAMPPETRFLLPVYRDREKYGDLRLAENRRRLAEAITGDRRTRFVDLRLDRDRIVEAIVAGPPTLGSALGTIWREYGESRGKPRWGEKRPLYSRHVDVILRLFPDAQIIHLVRDARACVASLRQVPFWDGSVAAAAAIWSLSEHDLQRNRARLPSDTFYSLRYEDLTDDPRRSLRELCRFLGEQFAPEMLDHRGAAREIVPRRKSWHVGTRRGVNRRRAQSWTWRLDPDEIGLVQRATRRQLLRNGYRLDADAPAPSPLDLVQYQLERARRAGAWRKARARDWLVRLGEDQPVAAQPAVPVQTVRGAGFG